MPFPRDKALLTAMATQSDVISAAIESVGEQVRWTGARIVGVSPGDVAKFEPLVAAFAQVGDLVEALRAFTHEAFTYGNVSVYVDAEHVVVWSPDWRSDPAKVNAAAGGHVLEAKRPPVVGGFGTPSLDPGIARFASYLAQQNRDIASLQKYIAEPVGAPRISGRENDLAAMNAVLDAIGFGPWDPSGDLPHLRNPGQVRAAMKDLFEREILGPFAAVRGVGGTPLIAP